MPFTLAHPAAVVPLRRAPLMRTVPLVLGAIAPDVPYFLPWRIAKHIPDGMTHTVLGTFTLDLPFGIVMLLFVWLLRVPLAAPLGPAARAKCLGALERFGSRPINWLVAPLSLLVGSWTHLAWDSFTHADGWMVSRISALSAPVSFFSYTAELCHVLQYVSSVLGLAVLAVWFLMLPVPETRVPNAGRSPGGPLLLASLLAAAAAAGGIMTWAHLGRPIPASYHLVYLLLTRGGASFALLYTLTGIVIASGRRRAAAPAIG